MRLSCKSKPMIRLLLLIKNYQNNIISATSKQEGQLEQEALLLPLSFLFLMFLKL